MSRIGKLPVTIPKGVSVEKGAAREVKVKGPKGELSITLRPEIDVKVDGAIVHVSREGDHREARAYHGMTRAVLACLQGDFDAAWAYNPRYVVVVPLIAWSCARLAWRVARPQPTPA